MREMDKIVCDISSQPMPGEDPKSREAYNDWEKKDRAVVDSGFNLPVLADSPTSGVIE